MKSKKDNIAEYILYLWQIEDYLRAFPEKAAESTELMELYDMMHIEGILGGGHLQLAQNALSELEDLHAELLDTEAPYRAVIMHLPPTLTILKAKTDRPNMSDVEACLVLLYQIMMLRLQKKEITPNTAHAVKEITTFIGMLSDYYKKDKEEGLKFE